MTTEEIEAEIIDRLEATITDLQIEGYPADFENYSLLHPIGAILVQYVQSDFTDPKAINIVTQQRTLQFRMILLARNLYTYTGAYAYLDSIRQNLTGYQIPGLSKMYPKRERFLGEKSGVWYYEITFAMNGRNVEGE